ncbi:MAG: glycosyltransferase family 39 protein [Candidatus Eisenbacteria sp.]|nr:glycosyltransferase family 39 protein [Candidatus Eisenbacteria bacterium]
MATRTESAPQTIRAAWILWLILLAALGIRLIYGFSLEPEIFWHDGREYSRLAKSILETGAYLTPEGNPTALWPPGYPFLLALIYALFGTSVMAVRAVQAVMGAATCYLVYLLGLRLLGWRQALLSAALAAIYPLFIYTTGTLYPVVLVTLLIAAVFLLALDAVERSSGMRALAAGLLSGWAVLAVAAVLPALLLTSLWIFWEAARKRAPEAARPGSPRCWGRGVKLALLFLAPLVLMVGTWTWRNTQAFGRPVLVSNNGGYNFWMGNYPSVTASTGGRWMPGMAEEYNDIHRRYQNEAEVDRALLERGLEHAMADPGRFAGLTIAKAFNLWRLYPQPMTHERPHQGVERIASILSYGLLLPFALIWLLRSLRRSPPARLVLLLWLSFSFVYAFFISKVRFRIPLDTFIILYASGGLIALVACLAGVLKRRGIRWSWLSALTGERPKRLEQGASRRRFRN